MKREECSHQILRFGSGCYYLFCAACLQRWVALEPGGDDQSPDPMCNVGPGGALSGQERKA